VLAMAAGPVPRRILRANTQLPAPIAERVAPLARRVAPHLEYPTTLEKAEAIQSFLGAGYAYTTELPGEIDDPLSQFLFETRRGHCEMFATAMTVMLRSLDVPARMVNGYLGGQWNEFLGKYVVRQNNAHAWVEVYFPTAGGGQREEEAGTWVQFDPTPFVVGPDKSERGLLAVLSRMADYVCIRWEDDVVHYGRNQQASLARYLTYLAMHGGERMRRLRGEAEASGSVALLSFLVRRAMPLPVIGAIILCAGWLMRHKLPFGANKSSRSKTRFYRDLLKLLKRRGHKRMPWQTPLEFSRRVVTCEGPQWAAVHAITMIFCDVRYGNPPQDAERDAQAMLKALRVRSRGNGKTK